MLADAFKSCCCPALDGSERELKLNVHNISSSNEVPHLDTDNENSQLILSLVNPHGENGSQHHWPDLFSEICEMLDICILHYPLVDIRVLARRGKLDELAAQKALSLPQTYSQLLSVVTTNKIETAETSLKSQFYLSALQAADTKSRKQTMPTTIVAVDDLYEQKELVYSLQLDHHRKRIIVCFRGSVTKLDWATNLEIYMKEVPNPMQGYPSQKDTIRVHYGFYDYLLMPILWGTKGPHGEDQSEYKEILDALLPITQDFPEYNLYVTGHSMGAALATLFAFQAATESDDIVPKPVSLFSFAGPYVGDHAFRSAHQLLESLGKLRHLRVSNNGDIVTIVPNVSFRWAWCSESHTGTLFKHVGMNIRLYSDSLDIRYPNANHHEWNDVCRGWDQSLCHNFSWNPSDYWKWPYHKMQSYSERIHANKSILQSIYLNDLYMCEDIVGSGGLLVR